MFFKTFTFNVYLCIAVLYSMKSILYNRGSFLSQGVTIIFDALTIYFAISAIITTKMPKVLKSYLVFMIVLVLYGLILYLSNDTLGMIYVDAESGALNFINSILISGLPIFASFYLTRKGFFVEKHFRYWLVVLFVVSILTYYNYEQTILAGKIRGQFDDELTNNAAYLFVGLIPPLCIFNKQRFVQFFGVGVCMFFLFLGVKRGAILTGIIEILTLIYFSYRTNTKKRKFSLFILTIALIVLAYLIVQNLMATSDYFQYKLEMTLEGYTSQRDVIANQIFNYISTEMSFADMLFGRGALATIKMFSNYAHNDWLELMVNQGLLGVSLFFVFFLYFYKTCHFSKNPQNKVALILVFVSLFIPTLFSMSYSSISFPLAYYFGHLLAKEQL